MNKLNALLRDIRDNLTDEDLLIEEYIKKEGATPLDILCEKETRYEIIELLKHIPRWLDPIDKKILELYIIDGKTMEQIGKRLKITQPAVTQRIQKIPSKIQAHAYKIPYFNNYYEGDFTTTSTAEAGSPKGCGFPFEFLRKINVGGMWGFYRHKPIWKSKDECILPEYFQKCFGDDKTVCPICSKCKRGETN
jgi:predicted DNA-binding protein YlxM (UPF0122 family)